MGFNSGFKGLNQTMEHDDIRQKLKFKDKETI